MLNVYNVNGVNWYNVNTHHGITSLCNHFIKRNSPNLNDCMCSTHSCVFICFSHSTVEEEAHSNQHKHIQKHNVRHCTSWHLTHVTHAKTTSLSLIQNHGSFWSSLSHHMPYSVNNPKANMQAEYNTITEPNVVYNLRHLSASAQARVVVSCNCKILPTLFRLTETILRLRFPCVRIIDYP